MRFNRDRRYLRQDDGSYVPEDAPDSTAGRLVCTSKTFRFDVAHWEVIHTAAGHDQSEEREPFTFRKDDPGSAYFCCMLEEKGRIFHAITESGTTTIVSPISLTVFALPSDDVEIEGHLTHHPRWESSFDGEVHEEKLSATLGIPLARFQWFLERLRLPGARATIVLDMRVYKEEIALGFDEDWMSQDLAVEQGSTSHISQYHLRVSEGPGVPEGDDEEDDAPDDWAVEVAATNNIEPSHSLPQVSGISAAQRFILGLGAILLLVFAANGATTYGSDQRLATFNFLAAVVCLYLAFRRHR